MPTQNANDNKNWQDHKSGAPFFFSPKLKKRVIFFNHNFHISNKKFLCKVLDFVRVFMSSKQTDTTSLLRAKLSEPQIKNVKIANF